LVDATEHYVKIGEFIDIKIHEAGDYDLYGTPIKVLEKPMPFHQKKGLKIS
jgi:ribosomal protein S12 methylthiotransferase